MNVSCTSCSAKYAVPDEKVRGKKVKITCKHCGTGIIVDGTKLEAVEAAAPVLPTPSSSPAAAPRPAPGSSPTAAAAPAAPGQELAFDIAYPDDRQETLLVSQIVAKYATGELGDDAFLWREGMADWKAPFDIPEVAAALSALGLSKSSGDETKLMPPTAGIPKEQSFNDDDEATKVQSSPFEGLPDDVRGEWMEPGRDVKSAPEAAFALQAAAAPAPAPTPAAAPAPPPAPALAETPAPLPFEAEAPAIAAPVAESPKPAAVTPAIAAASPKPAAAVPKAELPKPTPAMPVAAAPKPAAARRASARGGGDLFGDLAGAGSEDDVSLGLDAKDPGTKMTGQRNESSVLFSLDALVKQEQKPAKKAPAKQEDAAAILMGTDSGPSSLANVGAGGLGSAFAAPDFTAPVLAPPVEAQASAPVAISSSSAPAQPKKGGMGIWIALGAVMLLGGAAFALGLPAKLMGTPPAPSAEPPAPPKTDAATAPPSAAPVATPTPAPAESTAPAASAAPTPATAAGGAAATPATPAAAGGAAAKPATPAGEKPAGDKPAEKPADKPADKPAEAAAPASDAPPFDKAAAIAALSAAAGNAQSCKTPDGPTGSGKVSITFMPSGRATNTQISGDLAGTAVGGCVAKLFRSAKVPAFSGEAVTVSKSFSVQ